MLTVHSDVRKKTNKHVIQIQVLVTIQSSVKFRTIQSSDKKTNDPLVDIKLIKRTLDTEMIRSTRHCAERDSVKVEMAVLLDENHFLQGSPRVLEVKADSSFADGYFTASYEVNEAIPPPFDL